MKWSDRRQCWCVIPSEHKNLTDVHVWCNAQFGQQQVLLVRDGVWSWCHGDFYGLTIRISEWEFPDKRNYISFKNKEDALYFILRWGDQS